MQVWGPEFESQLLCYVGIRVDVYNPSRCFYGKLGGGEEFSDAHLFSSEQQKDPVSRQKMKTSIQGYHLAVACMHPHSCVYIHIHTCVIYICVSRVHSFRKYWHHSR